MIAILTVSGSIHAHSCLWVSSTCPPTHAPRISSSLDSHGVLVNHHSLPNLLRILEQDSLISISDRVSFANSSIFAGFDQIRDPLCNDGGFRHHCWQRAWCLYHIRGICIAFTVCLRHVSTRCVSHFEINVSRNKRSENETCE